MFEKCRNCGEEFSKGETNCPKCGCISDNCIEEVKEEDVLKNELSNEKSLEENIENISDREEVVEELKKVCKKCGNILNEDEFFCKKCGKKYISKNEVNKRKKCIIGLILLLATILIGIFLKLQYDKEQLTKAKESYINSVNIFTENITEYASDSEDTISTVLKYWNENIWENKHGKSIDDAILQAFTENYSSFESCKNNEENIDESYKNISSIPNGLEEDKDILSLKQSVKELYSAYKQLNNMALSPKGSYTSYSQEKNDLISNFNEKKSNLESDLY